MIITIIIIIIIIVLIITIILIIIVTIILIIIIMFIVTCWALPVSVKRTLVKSKKTTQKKTLTHEERNKTKPMNINLNSKRNSKP